MNGAHLHLLVNHLPVLGVPFGVSLLLASLWRMNATLQRTGLVVLLLGCAATEVADYTGDGAKDTLRQYMTTTFPKAVVHEHEDAADYAIMSAIALAIVSAAALWFARKGPLQRGAVIGVIVVGLFATSVLIRVADLGGQIRHVEIRSATAPPDSGTH